MAAYRCWFQRRPDKVETIEAAESLAYSIGYMAVRADEYTMPPESRRDNERVFSINQSRMVFVVVAEVK